jgi:hypothetical protein
LFEHSKLAGTRAAFHVAVRSQLARSWIGATVAALLSATGCARSVPASLDSGAGDDVRSDAPLDIDAPARVDAPVMTDTPAGCSISAGPAVALDGNNDLAKYPAAQQLAPGAMLGTIDAAAITWDANRLYITVASTAFENAFEPLHIYVETDHLDTPVASSGKEYSGLVPGLPFTATHLIAARQQSDSGTGGPYDGVYVPDATWSTRATPLDASAVFVQADHDAISVQVPWSALGGCPTTIRLALHVVHAVVANEWKDVVPSTHTPWLATGGGYYEIDVTGTQAITSWTLH